MSYAGASWVEKSLKRKLSPLGIAVANLLGRVNKGIYHLSTVSLNKVEWESLYYMEYIIYGELSTVDFNLLTALVVYAHDEMVRVTIRGCGPGYMKMQFFQRNSRTGTMSERYPTIEDHITMLRSVESAE